MSARTKEALCVTLEETGSTKRTVNFRPSAGVSLFMVLSLNVYLSFRKEFYPLKYIWEWFWALNGFCSEPAYGSVLWSAAENVMLLDIIESSKPLREGSQRSKKIKLLFGFSVAESTSNRIVLWGWEDKIPGWYSSQTPPRHKTQLLHCATYTVYRILHISSGEE